MQQEIFNTMKNSDKNFRLEQFYLPYEILD